MEVSIRHRDEDAVRAGEFNGSPELVPRNLGAHLEM
jgi:hypothetical protein